MKYEDTIMIIDGKKTKIEERTVEDNQILLIDLLSQASLDLNNAISNLYYPNFPNLNNGIINRIVKMQSELDILKDMIINGHLILFKPITEEMGD